MKYDKSGTGWGHGDTLRASDSKHGNCTDFRSVFISMARAEKIPARFQIGFHFRPTNTPPRFLDNTAGPSSIWTRPGGSR
jgi:transglutaminase-like putative cysteine protease